MGLGRVSKGGAIVFAVSALSHCVGATEIMLDLRTDVGCDVVDAKGVTIAVGEPNDDTTGVATRTNACDDAGSIGTLALLPHGDIDGPVAVRVVLGVNTAAESCSAPTNFSGCIVARRSLRYLPHTELRLPIDLDQDCLDNPCGPDSTCVHGACIDAGVTCDDNVCSVGDAGAPPGPDAGPIDAGGCVDTQPITIGTTSVVATPRIARTAQGYAIAWIPQLGTIDAEIVDANGNVVVQAQEIANLGASTRLDAIATDTNDQNYFAVYDDNGNVDNKIVPTAGGTSSTSDTPTAAGATGAFWDATQSRWVANAIATTTGNPASLYSFGTGQATAISSAATTHFDITHFGSTYYAATFENPTCVVRACSLQSSGLFTCTPTPVPQCTAIRAAGGPTDVAVSFVSNGTMTFETLGGGAVVPNGPIDDPEAMVPLVVGSTPYRIVWRTQDALFTDTFPAKGASVTELGTTNFTSNGGSGAGFDAVADDPTQTGYAVVYYQQGTSAITFQHRCK